MLAVVAGLLVLVVAANAQTVTPFSDCGNACQVQDLYWSTPTTGVIITSNAHSNTSWRAWKTTDGGLTWTTILRSVNQIVPTGYNSTVLYFPWASGRNMNYSVDGGVTIYPSSLPCNRKQVVEFQPHPTQIGWILITGCEGNNGVLNLCSLYTSQDYGKTWQTSFYHDVVDGLAMWGNSTQSLIFVWRTNWAYGYTTDFGKSFTTIFPDTLGFVLTQHYQFVAIADVASAYLYASSYRVDPTHQSKSSYRLAEFPFGDAVPQDFYTFIDDETRAEYIGVHLAGGRPWGTVYSSEFDGAYYAQSLNYVYSYTGGGGYTYDFGRFHGLNGIYLANLVYNNNDGWQDYPELITQITLDNGGSWQFLNKPAFDMFGNAWNCTSDRCALHLLGASAWATYGVPDFRTHSSAIGLIVANGNVGEFLGDGTSPLSTFFSRDGGVTWAQIFPEPTSFEFGNHGGVLVLAPVWMPTTVIYYSFNQGLTPFQQLKISNTNITVYMVTTDPTGSGTKFIIAGFDNDLNFVIYTVDFSAQLANPCQPSDYEDWAPNDGQMTSTACFMGATTVYKRRKQASVCYNALTSSDQIISQTPCPCSYLDYECDFNYESTRRNSTGGFACSKVFADPPCIKGTTYHVPTGYTLIPDTMCNLTNGLNLLGPRKTCNPPSHPYEIAAAVIVTLLLVGSIVTVVGLYLKNDRFRTWVKSLKSGRGARKYREINNTGDDDDDNTPFLSGH